MARTTCCPGGRRPQEAALNANESICRTSSRLIHLFMPKRQIIDLSGQRHFVTFSTYQRRRFLNPECTRNIVLEVLQRCLLNHHAACSGFAIMPNHVHAILFGSSDFMISRFMQVWKKTSSYRIKQFYNQELPHYRDLCPTNSPVWQAGFYDFNIDSDKKLLEKLNYMHSNPVKAGLVHTSVSWAWSSARFYEQGESTGVTITQ